MLQVGTVKNCDPSVRQAIQKLSIVLGSDSEPTFNDLILTGLTASRIVATDADKKLVSSDLVNWVTGTANQITITDDADGTITLSTPQDIHTGASPTFANLSLGTGELTTGSINRVTGTLTLEVGGTAEISITSTTVTLGGNLIIPDGGTIGSASDTDVITIDASGNATFSVFPITPSAAPDANYEVANKKYVDDEVAGGIGAGGHTHDTDTLQHDGVNSNGGAFSFTTTGAVTFNQSIVSANYTAANLLTAAATNAGEIDFTAASKKLDVEDNATVSQDYSSDASPIFAGLTVSNHTLALDAITFQPGTDYTTFFRVLDADGGTPIFNVDATNERVGIQTDAPTAPLDVSNGRIALVVGADSNASTRTNSTTKYGRIGTFHYTNAEEPIAILLCSSYSTSSQLNFGGGSYLFNACTQLKFYTAANITTTTGTLRLSINSSGNANFQAGNITTTGNMTNGVTFLHEQAAADADVAGDGQIWVKTVTPNQLWFTDDNGSDIPVAAANQAVTLGVGVTTFAITSNVMTVTGDPFGNTIATITGAGSGTIITLIFVDTNVTITDDNTHGANSVDLSAAFVSADDAVLQLVYDGTSWYEISRSVN